MRHSNLYFKDIYLGTLYENGRFDYMISSNRSDQLNMEIIIHTLEVIRESCLSDTFNFDDYVNSWNNFTFKDGFKFR